MAVASDRADRATIRAVLSARHGDAYDKASRAPVVTPPTQTVPRRRDFGAPPTTTVTPSRALPKPLMAVRTYGRLTYGLTPTSLAEFTAYGTTGVQRHDGFVGRRLLPVVALRTGSSISAPCASALRAECSDGPRSAK